MSKLKGFWQLILFLTIIFLGLSQSLSSQASPTQERPNVFLLTIDALRADHLGCYGYPRNTSPNIDELAKKGIIFKRAMCNWPKTTPSFASMLTGTYGRTNGVKGGCRQKLPLRFTTIGEVLAKHNYHTAAISNNANISITFQYNQGFKDFIEIWEKPEKHNCVTVTNYALEWLKNNYTKNFFLWIHYVQPHTHYLPPAPYNTMFVNDSLYKNTPDKLLPVIKNSYRNGIHEKNAYLPPHRNVKYYIAQYDGEIAFNDAQVKRLFDKFKELGIFDDTLIIVSADHGDEMGEHGIYFEHGTEVYQTTMNVPLIISYPRKIKAHKVIDENVTLIDLFPTILDYCNTEPIKQLEGTSFRPLIEGKPLHRPAVFAEGGYRNRYTGRFHSVVYSGDWKLIHRSDSTFQLFNLKKDPKEQLNLYTKETATAQDLTETLLQWEKKPAAKRPQKEIEETLQQPKLSEKARQQLRSLGYID